MPEQHGGPPRGESVGSQFREAWTRNTSGVRGMFRNPASGWGAAIRENRQSWREMWERDR